MSKKLLFLPLDDRPPNYLMVRRLAEMAGFPIEFPPTAVIRRSGRPAPFSGILRWITKQRTSPSGILLSLDALVYGGLVGSRFPDVSHRDAQKRLGEISKIRDQHSRTPLWVFATLLRSFPEDGPWQQTSTRKRNLSVLVEAIRMVRRGIIENLLIGVEDSRPGSIAEAERTKLMKIIRQANLEKRVFVVDGADELGQMMLARWVCHQSKTRVLFAPHFSKPRLSKRIARYESRSLLDNMKSHACVLFDLPAKSAKKIVIPLLLHSHDSTPDWMVDPPKTLLCDFSENDARWISSKNGDVAVADVAVVNGGCPEFVSCMIAGGRNRRGPGRRIYYAAWNTAGNTLGTVMAWAAIDPLRKPNGRFYRRFFLERMLDDVIYQTIVRQKLAGRVDAVLAKRLILHEFTRLFPNEPKFETRISFPWRRLFESEVEAILPT